MPTFANQDDANRWWGIGQSLGYQGKQDGSGGLGKWLDSNNLRSTAENHYNNNTTPTQSTNFAPVGLTEPLNDWQKQYATNQATGAPVTGDMAAARGLLSNASNGVAGARYDFNAQPYIGQAQNYTNASTQQFGQGDANRLMNPYTNSVVDTSNAEIRRQQGLLTNGRNTSFSNGGAFGSARQGVYDAEADRNTGDLIARNTAGLLSQGYTQAMGQFNNERSQNANAAGQAIQTGNYGMSDAQNRFNAPITQANALTGLANADVNLRNNYLNQWTQGQNGMLQAGNMVQNQNQKGLDAYNTERLNQANWGQNQTDWYGSALGKYPQGTTAGQYQPNTMQQVGGAGLLGAGYLQSQNGSNGGGLLSNNTWADPGAYIPTGQTNVNGTPWLNQSSTPGPWGY